jgi:protocatechuate 3,4-dioxygenase beta subunit
MEQSRKKFIRELLIGATSVPLLIEACKKDTASTSSSSSDDSGSTSTSSGCVVAPTEEEGPFPYTPDGTTKDEIENPLNRTDIRSDVSSDTDNGVLQTGVLLTVTLTIVNTNNDCAAVSGARVDTWHCNRNGWYSGYGNQSGGLSGTSNSYLGETWLRGYQLSDSNGKIQFTTIYPGWYQGRATHIHFEVFINGTLKKITQMAFPETISDAVHVTSLYAAHGVNPVRNASDSVFGDSATDLANETFTITGDATNGYTATHQIGLAL